MKITPIRVRRINAGLELEEAVEKLGISKSTFYKLEQGCGNTPSAQLIKKMSVAYGCTTDEIFRDLKIN